jgi:NADH-quinone oxidoreductase subunit G
MPKCTINGKEITVADGTTIIQAFKDHHVEIAHYCWHPGLSVAGVCRLCMVEIEGNPRPQIACNTVITEGMKINNTSAAIKDTVRWGMDFHLINHPLDCPICDQAGECGLQEQYMQYGKYDPEMAERKVKKRKVVDLGPRVVLDTERCILCSRCVRFTTEVSKTNELGIFNRGDRSEIGTFEDRPLDNNYSVNTVDICPVGALTSRDFRFKQRVWFLKDAPSVCNGCSTGCNIRVYYNKEGVFRVKPVYNKDVNGHWMCDQGRDIYKYINREFRMVDGVVPGGSAPEIVEPGKAAKVASEALDAVRAQGQNVAVVVTGQYTNEEYEAILGNFKAKGHVTFVHWINNPESLKDFDGILYRGDKNPNTAGLLKVAQKLGVTLESYEAFLPKVTEFGAVVVLGPENQGVYPTLAKDVDSLKYAKKLVWLASTKVAQLNGLNNCYQIPVKSFIEKDGTFTNFAGVEQKVKKAFTLVSQALTLSEVAVLFGGQDVEANAAEVISTRVRNEFVYQKGAL